MDVMKVFLITFLSSIGLLVGFIIYNQLEKNHYEDIKERIETFQRIQELESEIYWLKKENTMLKDRLKVINN